MASSHDENEDIFDDEMAGEEASEPPPVNKRKNSGKSSSSVPPKPRKRIAHRAEVWKLFLHNRPDDPMCFCRSCDVEIACDSKVNGTSAMKSHIAHCKLYKASQESGTQQVLRADSSGVVTALRFDKGIFRRSVNEMIVLNELPFSFVESEGFRRFCHNVIPMYTVHCRKTATEDIFKMFLQEKASLKKLFSCDKKRVSLTTDIWVAPTTSISYMVVTSHWIDVNWDLQKRILSFKPITDHKGDTISAHLISCLEEWGIEKVFTVTVDNAKGNDKALKVFTDCLRLKGDKALVKDGAYLHMRCCAHILNLIVRDGLAHVRQSIIAIRNGVKYVRSSPDRLKTFEIRLDAGKVSRDSLSMDCITRWNSTYLMLTAAIKLRVGFENMRANEIPYNKYFEEEEENGEERVGPPTESSWDEVERFVKFLRIFFNSTLRFSASKTVTSTICYEEVVNIERNLILLSNNKDVQVRQEATTMRLKFEKYWDGLINMNPLVIIACVFDPRNKMRFATRCFDSLYGKDSFESKLLKTSIKKVMRDLYEEYVLENKHLHGEEAVVNGSENAEEPSVAFDLSDDEYERMDSLYSDMDDEDDNEEVSSELDIYLMEKQEPRDKKNSLGLNYNVLSWWKRNSAKYLILSELAKDVLAIQVSSVASESAFSTSGRILDPYRSCLSPHMVESLICSQQWLRNSIHSEAKLASLAQMLEELDFHESLEKATET
ncbi:unnamed protein product [Microthlaspi erraticum]|uniref:BED-type domain-containing protein n=1 Tax=Microthlaspi erraticum TaxID=1685480 RepID=A0A6D2JUX4_9BRAS|nr:unnamed protein product [Microthlaspi erraticum]CAA7052769.1 unnamed protein product [Microthlaspi erraticum]